MREIRALTGLRGIAAITVFFAHTRETLESRGLPLQVPELVRRLFLSGGRQVDIFFVLSGFILALIYRDWFAESLSKQTYIEFLRRRFARIYPLHAFMLLLVLCFVLAAHFLHANTANGLERYTFRSLPAHFFLIQAWGFSGEDPGSWNPPSWSISIEALAYLLFPFFMWFTSRYEMIRPWLLLTLGIACGFALNAWTYWGLAGVPGISRGLSEFALGCIAAGFYGKPVAIWLQSNIGSALAAALIVICFALTPDTGFIVGLCTVPLLLALSGDNTVSRLLSMQPIYFLGEISFSVYLGHFLFTTISYRLISPAWMATGTLPLVMGLFAIATFVLALSTLTYYFIERPARGILRSQPIAR